MVEKFVSIRQSIVNKYYNPKVMRFIRKKHIITTVFNKDLTDIDDVKIVFNSLNEYKLEFSIIMRKLSPSNDYNIINFEKVVIKKIHDDDSFDLISFKHGSKIIVKNINFNDVIEIEAITMRNEVLNINSELNKFNFLDI
jgi:hypothetical protein